MRIRDGPGSTPSVRYLQNKKRDSVKEPRFYGGGGWIRTTEGEASRFTVCPLWPLGYSSLFSFKVELVDGFEPPTC